jgi:ribonuclease T1
LAERLAAMTGRARSVVAVVALVVVVGLALLVGSGSEPVPGPVSPAPAGSAGPARTASDQRDPETGLLLVEVRRLPRQVQETVALIERGGPYPYRQDGDTFSNREHLLPPAPKGFYREFTVATSGSDDRGARRIVTGDRDRQLFYTPDHYKSFVQIRR